MKIVNAFVWVQIYLPNNVQWPRGTINNFLLFVSTVHACNTANRVMGSLIFLTFNWAELKSAKASASLYSNNPSCHNHASSCWKYSKLSSRVCSSDYSHTTTGIRSKLTLDKGKCSETMDFQQIMINHKRPTLKNKANFQPRSDVWETNEEIPYWWCITILNYAVLLMGWKFASCNQKQYTTHILKEWTKRKRTKISDFAISLT